MDSDHGIPIGSTPMVVRTVGLFVPVDFLTAVFGQRSFWFPCFLVLAAAFGFVVDRLIRRVGLSGWTLIASCLAALFVMTFIVDLIMVLQRSPGAFLAVLADRPRRAALRSVVTETRCILHLSSVIRAVHHGQRVRQRLRITTVAQAKPIARGA